MYKSSKRLRRRRGLTLVEVLLVLTILVIIMSMVAVAIIPMHRKALIKAADVQIKAFETPLQTYCLDLGSFPGTSQGLEALREMPSDLAAPEKWAGPYLSKPVPLDPWQNPYRYENPGKYQTDWPDIWSYGPDGMDGTEDDIGNWATIKK